jgi:hypothetical protein
MPIAEAAYALTNPLAIIAGKPREEFTRQDLVRIIEREQIERITFHYTALDGKYKELKIPIANRYQAERILADGERVVVALQRHGGDDALGPLRCAGVQVGVPEPV